MGKLSQLEIELDHDIDQHYHYKPGEKLSGKVILKVEGGTFKMLRLNFSVTGSGSCGWIEDSGQQWRAQETYIDETMTLAPTDEEDSVIALPPGTHEYRFDYVLPAQVPSSFIGKFGSVTYILKAIVKEDTRYGLGNVVTSEPFLVLNRYQIPAMFATNPQKLCAKKRIWKGMRYGKVTACLGINKPLYSPGEEIIMNSEVLNSSSKLVSGLQALLIMTSTFTAAREKKTHIQIISKKYDKWQLTKGEGRRWKDAKLPVPNYAPESKLEACDIIEIRYDVILKVEIQGKKELKVSIPIEVYATDDTKLSSGMPSSYGDTYRSMGNLTLDKATLEKVPLNELLGMTADDPDGGLTYDRPIDDGTVRINPLYKANSVDLDGRNPLDSLGPLPNSESFEGAFEGEIEWDENDDEFIEEMNGMEISVQEDEDTKM